MTYLGITQPTADWLLAKKDSWLHAIFSDLLELLEKKQLRRTVLLAGPLRLAASQEGRLIAFWNPDYLSNTGTEPWGFIRLSEPTGLLSEQSGPEVLERCVYVINQRLQGLLLDDRLIHKKDGEIHTCLAGRGTQIRQLSIAYVETELNLASGRYRSIVCVGPERDLSRLRSAAQQGQGSLANLATLANNLISEAVLRPPLEGLPSNLHGQALALQKPAERHVPVVSIPALTGDAIDPAKVYETLEWTYENWTGPASTLTDEQRQVLESDVLLEQPIRLIGAAGSGKTLLMQLLAIRRLVSAETSNEPVRVLYVVHNAAMMDTIWLRFVTLGAERFLDGLRQQKLEVHTLFEHSRRLLEVEDTYVIDPDAQATKLFQQEVSERAIVQAFATRETETLNAELAPLLSIVASNEVLKSVFADLVVSEIGVAIKGHGLHGDRARYVGTERPLSRLHGALTSTERDIVFDIYEAYHKEVFENREILDTDDLALSLLGRMRTPIWEMKRRKLGFDFVFVDETQLFNENERRLFPLLTRGEKSYVPIALALDQAQEIRGSTSAGLGLLGIRAIADQKLTTVQRSTAAILKLAFNVIQHTTDLFGPEFPDFTEAVEAVIPEDHPLAAPPQVITPVSGANLAKFVLRQVRKLRRENLRQIAIVVHAEELWQQIRERLVGAEPNLLVMTTRGERVSPDRPVVALTYPGLVGGQEFDGVIAVGIEQGRVPPRVQGNDALASTLEQRALRELYVSFTRARYRLLIVNSAGSAPSTLLNDAIRAGFLRHAAPEDE